MDLNGKVAIVTGASAGIGRATASALAERGCHVVAAARDAARLEALAAERAGAPGAIVPAPVDVADEGGVRAVVEAAVARFGALDVLVSNAAYALYAPIEKLSLAALRRLMDVNFYGAVHCVQAALPHLRRAGAGRIAIVGSLNSHLAVPDLGAYCATKFALRAFTDALRVELLGSGVRVTGVYPGLTRSEFLTRAVQSGARPVTAGRRPISAERVARAIAAGLERGSREVYVLPSDRLILLGAGLFPALFDRLLFRYVHLRS